MQSINWTVFIVSFLIGLVFIYLSSSPDEEVYVYPTPENAGTMEYKDKADNCFCLSSQRTNMSQNQPLNIYPYRNNIYNIYEEQNVSNVTYKLR